ILSRKAVVTASHNSSERESAAACLPGTCEDVLDRVYTWADSRTDNTVCLVYGPLGSGKSTLATTIAEKYDRENRLAGTFFFSGDPSHDPERRSLDRFVATIAYQNSISHPNVKKKVIQVLDSDPAILSKSLEIQFDNLLVSPFRRPFLYPPPMIVVIDAINECHGPLQMFIKILADKYCESPPPIRFFVTSRPEEEILGEFNCFPKRVYPLNLTDFPAHKDIEIFCKNGFNTLRNKHLIYRGSQNVGDWPSPQDLDLSVGKSEGLFVYASSLLNF
ncbi:hypothetical protein K443DRAFT_31381, partial [Laccaria amethystina LaAM-08-1]